MKYGWICLCLILGMVSIVLAQDTVNYVANNSKVMVRRGPSIKNKIVQILPVNAPVTVLEKGKDWTRIRTTVGVEGFILSRFLTADVPASIALKELQQSYDTLKQQTAEPMQAIEALTTQNRQLTQSVTEQKAAYKALEGKYKSLSHRSQNVVKLQNEYDAVKKQLAEAVSQVNALKVERDNLKLSQRIRWFLAGAGVLILGMIIGYSAKRKRGRSSSLY
jgi:SH3 domain protein